MAASRVCAESYPFCDGLTQEKYYNYRKNNDTISKYGTENTGMCNLGLELRRAQVFAPPTFEYF